MKNILIVTFLSISFYKSYAQKVVFSSLKQNTVFLGVNNPISFVMEQEDCNNIIITTDNGTLKKYDKCGYDYTPSKEGMAQFIVRKRGSKQAQNILVRVLPLPVPQAFIAKKGGGFIDKNELTVQDGVLVNFRDIDLMRKWKVTDYTIQIIREGNIVHHKSYKGAKFDIETKNWFKASKKNDVILIFNIFALDNLDQKHKVNPIEFIVL